MAHAPSSVPPVLPGVAWVVAAAMLWGTTGTIQGLLPAGREPLVVATLRVAFGAAALWAFCLSARVPLRTLRALPWWRIAGAGAAIAGYNFFFFSGVARAGVGVGTALTLGSGPLWVLAWECLRSGTMPGLRRLGGQAVAILGLVILMAGGLGHGGSGTGYGLAALAGLAYGTYVILTGGFRAALPSALIAAATFSVSSALLLPTLAWSSLSWIDGRSALLLAFLGVAATGLAFWLFTAGVRRMSASSAATLALAEPLTAWILATAVLGEPLTASRVLGAVLLLLGLWAVAASLEPRRSPGCRPRP